MERSPATSSSDDLIDAKASVDREIRSFRELRDLHTRLHFGLINLNRALCRLEGTDGERFTFDASELDGDRDTTEVLG